MKKSAPKWHLGADLFSFFIDSSNKKTKQLPFCPLF